MKPVIRCSSLDQLFRCPGSRTLISLVKPREGEESFEGTYGHWAIARRIVVELGGAEPPGGLLAPRVPDSWKPSPQTDWLIDFCYREAKRINADWSLEVEVPLSHEFDEFILSGHLDLFAVNASASAAEGMDWKLGYIPVDPADSNEQIAGYIALEKLAYSNTLDRALFSLVQPRNDEDQGDQRVSTVEVGGSDFEAIIDRLQRKVGSALQSAHVVDSGVKQCRYCDAAMQCPAVDGDYQFMRTTLTPELLAKIKREPDDARLADIVMMAATLNGPSEEAKDMLYERLDTSGTVVASNGTKITQTIQGGKYDVINPVGMYAAVTDTLPAAEVAKVVSYSTTQLKDACAKHLVIPKTGKAERTAEKLFDEKFRPHLKQGKRRVLKFA